MLWKQAVTVCMLIASTTVDVRAQEPSPELRHAAAVMLSQFETVSYTKSDFLVDSESPAHTQYVEAENALRLPFIWLLGGLMTADQGALSSFEQNYGDIVTGAKDFVMPQGLGLTGFHTSYIGVSKSKNPSSMEPFFRQVRHETIGGKACWAWESTPDEAFPTQIPKLYAAQVGAYFVLSNDRTTFEETLRLVEGPGNTKPVLAEWDMLSAHSYWIYRSVKQRDQPAGNLAPDIQSILLFTDHGIPRGKGKATVRITSSDKTMEAAPRILSSAGAGGFKQEQPGVWQTVIPLPNDTVVQNDYPLDFILGSLGYGLAL